MFQWRARPLAIAVCAVSLLAQDAVFRTSVNLVRVTATVRSQTGALIGTLAKEDFEIYDNGAKQEVSVFARQTEQPVSVALLIDTSGSTAKELKFETESASKFLHSLLAEGNPEDRVALFSFNYDITQGEFTRNYPSLERQLRTLHGEAGTSVYDAVYYASRALEQRQGRKVIVLVTDGGDTTSSRDLKQSIKAAQLADTVIYPVVVLPIVNDAGRNIGAEHALELMAQGTGGRTFVQAANAQLDKAFSDIISELRTQFLLGFYPRGVPLTKDPFHRLEVRTRSAGLRVSSRNGYYGESEGSSGSPDARISVTPDRKKR